MTNSSERKPGGHLSVIIALLTSGIAVVFLAFVVLKGGEENNNPSNIIELASTHISAVPPDGLEGRLDEMALWTLNALHGAMAAETGEQRAGKLALVTEESIRDAVMNGPLAAHGLEQSPEDFHEVELLSQDSVLKGDKIEMRAQWRPVGLVAGEGHRHRIGYVFSGVIEAVWRGSEWRVSGVAVSDIDQSHAGTIVDAQPQ